MKGFFLSIEGIEGVGKSTAVKFICDFLKNANKSIVQTREPGGTDIAEKIRSVLLIPNENEKMLPETELLLMFASRAQLIQSVISPALSEGKWVVSDRFVDASFAYQGGGRQLDIAQIETLEKWVVGNTKPNLTILLDAPVELGLMRAKNRGPQDRIEQEKVDFFERVRAAYLLRAKKDPARFHVIDATQSLEKVQAELEKILSGIL